MNEENMLGEKLKKSKEQEQKEDALPWIEQTRWRKRIMYKGWMLEHIVERLGELAAITRSHYGYRVLNTPDLGFIDVDFNLEYDRWCQEREVISRLREWATEHPEQSWRAYRTAGGMRLMRTDASQPLDDQYDVLCKLVGADELYRSICHEQNCFRARLTPKPLRCGIEMPRWNPYWGWDLTDPDGTIFPLHLKAYELLADQYKTCDLVEVVGSGVLNPDLKDLVELHDSTCKVYLALPLEPLHSTETDGPTCMELLRFNNAYRTSGFAPDLIWNVFTSDVQLGLQRLDNPAERDRIRAEHERMQHLSKKWGKECIAYCDFTKTLSAPPRTDERKTTLEESVVGSLDDEDYFSMLANSKNDLSAEL